MVVKITKHPSIEEWLAFGFHSLFFCGSYRGANLFVTALREQMNVDHPIRRFMAPFTYRTIGVNDNAFHNLIRKGGHFGEWEVG